MTPDNWEPIIVALIVILAFAVGYILSAWISTWRR